MARLLLFILICLAVGGLGSLATQSSLLTWYAELQKPPLNPPNWVFAPVWTTLYVLMAFAGWRIWKINSSVKNRLRFLFSAQLVLNGIWSFLFFKLRSPLIALIDILVLWGFVFILIKNLWKWDKQSSLLLIPYLLWLSFALYLNAALYWLNV